MQTLKSTGLCLDVRAAPGNKFLDVSRYHHSITNNNVVTAKGLGSSLAGKYNGTTAYLDCGNHSSLNITNAITIETWVKPADMGDYQYIVHKSQSTTDDRTWGLQILDTDYFRFWASSDGTWQDKTAMFSSTVTYDEWANVVGVYDGTNLLIYVNGIGVTGDAISSILSNNLPVKIGIYENNYPFDGIISYVRIYNRALPAYEILDHYYEYAAYLGKQ